MKLKNIIVCLLSQASLALAQTPESKIAPLPPGPILANPEFAQWQAVAMSETEKQPAQSTATTSSNASPPVSSKTITTVTKTKNLRFEVIDNPIMGRITKWCDGDLQLISTPKEPEPSLYTRPDPDPAHNFFQSYAKSPFPEIAWVTPKNYVGIQKFEGRDCMVFETKTERYSEHEIRDRELEARMNGNKLTIDPLESSSTLAFIAVETHLPVCLKKPNEVRHYQFSPNPTSMLEFPAKIKSLYELYRQQQKTSTTAPARS